MQTQTAPVLVVGSGPSGLATALLLRMNGIGVRLIEKRPTYLIGQRGSGIFPRTQEMHHFLGTLPDIQERALPVPTVRMFAPPPNADKVIKEMQMTPVLEPTPAIPFPNPILLGQNNQEAIFRKHLAKYDCHVELETELCSFEQFEDHVVALIAKKDENGQRIEERSQYRWVIGADGARGIVRKRLGLSFLGETRHGTNMLIGDIYTQGNVFDKNIWYMWGQPQQSFVSIRPTEEENIVNFIMSGPNSSDTTVEPTRQDFLNTFYQTTGKNDIKFGDLVWIGNYRPNIRMVDNFGKGRVFLVGDAAHVHSPTGGQGMNTCVQDAFNLAWKLALIEKGHSTVALLDSYSEERLPIIAEMLQITTKILNLALKGDRDNAWRRDGNMNMLGVNYRGSSIVLHEGLSRDGVVSSYEPPTDGVLRAGDRAPDAPGLVTKDGQRTRLFDIFKPTRHTVLIFGSEFAPIIQALKDYPKHTIHPVTIVHNGQHSGVAGSLVDQDGHAAKNYNASAEERKVVIVRPDGVIGGIVSSTDGVKEYFGKIFA